MTFSFERSLVRGAMALVPRFRRSTAALAALPAEDQVRLAYEVLLRREPDPGAVATYVPQLRDGHLGLDAFLDGIRTSEEFRVRTPIGPLSFLQSLHLSRIELILGLPPAKRIVDLGGSATYSDLGALVLLGYPYDFDLLTIVDLPPEDRHDLYRSEAWQRVETAQGPVEYVFRSMTDLSFLDDDSIDLVFSGQSIEHVSRGDAAVVVEEVARVLRPGGHFVLDTPNGPVCRLQSPDFIDPDHEHEYALAELDDLLAGAGLTVVERKGLNLGHRSVAAGRFDAAEFAAHPGVYADAESCYLLAVTARK
jgi:SAM-dependent methyltransferase